MRRWAFLLLAIPVAVAWSAAAQAADPAEKDLVRVNVTVMSKGSGSVPEVTREDIIVRQDGDRRPVVDWVPAGRKGVGLDLVVLMDDSLNAGVGLQLADMSNFIRSLPPTTRVAVAYASNGTARFEQELTAEHELAARALRLPTGAGDAASGIYEAVSDLSKHWPGMGRARSLLLISDGIDLLRGVRESSPALNQDLQRAIEDAQRSGVTVYTLYASGAAQRLRNFYLINNGQGCLARLAYETGGESLFQGFDTPVSFQPLLQQVKKGLERQYVLTFRAALGAKPGFHRLRVATEQPGVELVAPTSVYIPGR